MECVGIPTKYLKKFGVTLRINPSVEVLTSDTYVVDCETDEKDNFVGLALYDGSNTVYYFSWFTESLIEVISKLKLIGHNLKGDAHWLQKWGVKIKSDNLVSDTMLQSYVISSTKESHHLKDLAKEHLKMEWPTYKQMVHPIQEKPGKKVTLDKQDVETVADYCGSDAVATWRLHQYFNKVMTPTQKRIYNTIELPLMQLLYEMETTGISLDTERLQWLDLEYREKIEAILEKINKYTQKGINLNSPKQLLTFFKDNLKINIPNTVYNTIKSLKNCKFANLLLAYRRLNKLHSTYIHPFLEMNGKVHCDFNQVTHDNGDQNFVGISTGRLSCRKPNLQNIPAHGEDGKEIRKLFIPEKGRTLIVADYSQVEYRLLAHFSQEPRLLEAFRNGKDVHTETALALGVDRSVGKTLNFAAIYGAGSKKIAATAGISEEKAKKFLEEYWKVLPKVKDWINKVKYEASAKRGIYTLSRRFIPLQKIRSSDMYERFHWERAAVNYIIQGSAAEIIKMAMLECNKQGYKPLLTVHDELLFEFNHSQLHDYGLTELNNIKNIMESIIKLNVPLTIDIHCGQNWLDAKGVK